MCVCVCEGVVVYESCLTDRSDLRYSLPWTGSGQPSIWHCFAVTCVTAEPCVSAVRIAGNYMVSGINTE